MSYSAVIFDLFGTLVDNFHEARFTHLLRQVRQTLGIPSDAFWKTWASEPFSVRRTRGDFETFEHCLREVCQVTGDSYDPAVVPAVIDLRRQIARENMAPRPDTIQTLRTLRDRCLKIGLVSDCGWEVVDVWPETPMAPLVHETVFSCAAGLKKPDPRIYDLICRQLAVQPADCVYIGDCGSDELAGARQAGMDAALICAPYEETMIMARPEAQCWDGPRISSVAEVLHLLRNHS